MFYLKSVKISAGASTRYYIFDKGQMSKGSGRFMLPSYLVLFSFGGKFILSGVEGQILNYGWLFS